MSVNDSLHVEKRKYIRYEKHFTITVYQLPEDTRGKKIVPISSYKTSDIPRFSAELTDISAGGLSMFCFKNLDISAAFHSTLILPSGDEIDLDFRIIHSEKTDDFEGSPAFIYGCEYISEPPEILNTLYFDDFMPV